MGFEVSRIPRIRAWRGGAWEGLGASLSDIHDPMRPRVLGLAGALGWGSQGREGQENAIQGGVPWSLGPVLEAESLQNCPTKRIFAQGGEGSHESSQALPFSASVGGLEEHRVWGWRHTRTHAHVLTFSPAFMTL